MRARSFTLLLVALISLVLIFFAVRSRIHPGNRNGMVIHSR